MFSVKGHKKKTCPVPLHRRDSEDWADLFVHDFTLQSACVSREFALIINMLNRIGHL
jgi:hypothetical protein